MRKTDRRRASYHHGDLRAALLDAAELELAEKGVEGFSLRGCAKRAGVSHAAPAHHFKSADALLTALATLGFERLVAAMRRNAAEAPADASARLTAIGLGYIEFAQANPALFKLVFSSDRPDNDDVTMRTAADEAFQVLVNGIADLGGEAPLSSASGIQRLSVAWAVVHGLSHLLIEQRMPFLQDMPATDRPAMLAAIVSRAVAN